jgi:hypothetical protein
VIRGLSDMNQARVMFVTAIAVVLTSITPAAAQDVIAEIETWRGTSVRLAQPSLDALYTIVPAPLVGPTGAPTTGGAASAPAAGGATMSSGRTVAAATVGTGPPPIQARREQNTLTFLRDGVEIRVPFDRIAGLVVERRAIVTNTLPPHVSPTHAQYWASAVLIDGSTIEAASVNFGTTILRGSGPQGTIELPLEDVKTLKITR